MFRIHSFVRLTAELDELPMFGGKRRKKRATAKINGELSFDSEGITRKFPISM
jgi:hypothetical protein